MGQGAGTGGTPKVDRQRLLAVSKVTYRPALSYSGGTMATEDVESEPTPKEGQSNVEFVEGWVVWARQRMQRLLEERNATQSAAARLEREVDRLKKTVDAADVWMKSRQESSVFAYPVGQIVLILAPRIKATVETVHIDRSGVHYGVYWWSGSTRHRATVAQDEVSDGDYLPDTTEVL